MQSNTLSAIPSASEIAARLRANAEDLHSIANDIVAAVDVNPKIIDELAELGVPRPFLNRLERFGRGQIHPALATSNTPGATKLITCPLSEQALALEGGVEVLDVDETTIRRIPVHELTGKQAAQAVALGRLRSISEQRTYLRDRKPHLPISEPEKGWFIKSGTLNTTRPFTGITRELLVQWLALLG